MRALITGIYGMDAWYLSELLISKGYEVVGTRRGNDEPDRAPPDVKIVYGDVTDAACIRDVIEKHRPDEVYNLAAITHVGDSFGATNAAFQVNAMGAANVLDAAMRTGAKVYQASTSELFGATPPPQNEASLLQPRSPYACGKLAAYWLTKNYRERGVYACQGILFNHESPRRGAEFVTQKVCSAAAVWGCTVLGNLDACRDWGHAKDYVRAMWLIMQQDKPDDYVVATGVMHSVRDLCRLAYARVGRDWQNYVASDDAFRRPLEVEKLCGDASKIRALGWAPEVTFQALICEMVDAAREKAERRRRP